jgi:hypothetical protein
VVLIDVDVKEGINMDDFEIFSRKIERGRGPSVTLTRTARFNFNKSAFALFEEKAVDYLLLLWSARRRVIGFKPILKKDLRAYRMRYAKRGDWCGFSSATFFKHIAYKEQESHTLPVKWDKQKEIFVVEVPQEFLRKEGKQPSPLVSKRSTKKSKLAMELPSKSRLET